MKIKKLIPVLALTLGSATLLSGCNSGGDKITIWTFSNELKQIVNKYYGGNANVVIKSSVTEVQQNLVDAIDAGRNIPDVVALEAAVIADFTSKSSADSVLLPLDDIGGTNDMYEYTKSVATSTDGKLLGLSWQATPGGFFYKKDIAERLGITSPEAMQSRISSWDKYLQLAAEAKTKSIAICSAITDPVKVFLSSRNKSWVENNKLQMEEVMFGGGENQYNCFDVVRKLQQEGYTHETTDRGPGWVRDIDSSNTLGFFCSSWGLNFDLMPNAKTTSGNWQMCKAPVDYFKGGTWLAIPKLATKIDAAKDFIKFITTDKQFLKDRGNETGDFMNSKTVMQSLSQNYSCEFLGGQNHLKILYEVAQTINGSLISPYDAAIDSIFTTTAANYARDEAITPKEVEEAREDHKAAFLDKVHAKYPLIEND